MNMKANPQLEQSVQEEQIRANPRRSNSQALRSHIIINLPGRDSRSTAQYVSFLRGTVVLHVVS